MPRRIPKRKRIGDSFEGVVLRIGDATLLSTASVTRDDINVSHDNVDTTSIETIHDGYMTVRYAICYLGKPHLCIVPGLLALDTGEMMTGEEAWDFILNKSNLYPRADVQGYRQDGEDDMVFIKKLDVMRPIQLLLYEDADATTPFAQTETVIAQDPEQLPARIREYATIYPSISVWMTPDES